LRPWLYAITRYKIADAFRARGAFIDLPIEDFTETLPAPVPEDGLERRDVNRLVATLDPRSADIVRAIGINGASITETGQRLRMTEGAVRVALHRALRRLSLLRKDLLE
jgi:DNA-directed RNA polymerase specialized sigma24 family protein